MCLMVLGQGLMVLVLAMHAGYGPGPDISVTGSDGSCTGSA